MLNNMMKGLFKQMEGTKVIIITATYKGLDEALKRAEQKGYISPFCAENIEGENIVIQRYPDCIQLMTFQHNDWIRVNEYYPDGTITETYER